MMAGDWHQPQVIPNGYYKCATCGAVIPSGSTHYCVPQSYSLSYGWGFIDNETKELLKRIAEALEKLADK